MASDEERLAEWLLLAECRAGNSAAWRQLVDQYQTGLLAAIRLRLGPKGRDQNLTEEIVQRVWCGLLENDYRRLRDYDSTIGGLTTFLAALARAELASYFRERFLQRRIEGASLANRQPQGSKDLSWLTTERVREFLATLPLHERVFFEDYLFPGSGKSPRRPYSRSSISRLRKLILSKLRIFLGID